MMPLLKAEYRKLFSIRSTYVLLGVAALLVGFVSFWVTGFRGDMPTPSLLMSAAENAATTVPMFLAIIAILLITHEYRYNTIMYTLTAANSRSKVLLAKIAVLFAFGIVTTIAFMIFGAFAAWVGVALSGNPLPTQYIYFWDTLWPSLFYSLGWMLTGLLFGVLFRHVVGAIVVIFLVPSTVEGLLSLLLKENSKYLPFMALERVHTGMGLSPGKAALIFSGYLLAGWAIAWYLYVKRDAN